LGLVFLGRKVHLTDSRNFPNASQFTSLIVSPKAHIVGSVIAEHVVVNGRVEGPIQGGEVALGSKAHVVGDIHHESLTIEKGAYFDGRAKQAHGTNERQPESVNRRTLRQSRDAAAE
jgi:cytoskeletal protein CcmA (bactofilin family)